jgi:hypothetical protein
VIGAVKESGADLAIPASSVLVTNPISLITSSVTSLGEGYIGISTSLIFSLTATRFSQSRLITGKRVTFNVISTFDLGY